jgi:hypothetical protein
MTKLWLSITPCRKKFESMTQVEREMFLYERQQKRELERERRRMLKELERKKRSSEVWYCRGADPCREPRAAVETFN